MLKSRTEADRIALHPRQDVEFRAFHDSFISAIACSSLASKAVSSTATHSRTNHRNSFRLLLKPRLLAETSSSAQFKCEEGSGKATDIHPFENPVPSPDTRYSAEPLISLLYTKEGCQRSEAPVSARALTRGTARAG